MIKKFFKTSELKTYYPDTELEGHLFCLDENTEIYIFKDKLMKKRLKDLNNNFKVISYNFEKKVKEIKDATKIDTGVQECYEIELKNGKKVISTSNHRFFDKDNNEVFVKNLKVGDEISVMKGIGGTIGKNKNNGLYNNNMGFKQGFIPWHKGKTKKEFPQIMRKGNPNYKGWNKGLTKETDERVNKISEKLKGMPHPWQLGDKNVSKRADVRKKLSKSSSGKNNGMYRKKLKDLMTAEKWKERNLKISKNNCMKNEKYRKRQKIGLLKVRDKLSIKGERNGSYGIPRYPVMFYVDELKHKVRSSWEKEVCIILKENSVSYEYEPQYFKVGNHTYTPDIKINDKKYIEVKGPLFGQQIEKMKKFKKLNKDITFIIITDKKNFKKLNFCDILIDYNLFIKRRRINEILKN